jgi:nicotinamide phosphoribosyltransferase
MDRVLPVLLADFYKISHRVQYPKNTQFIFSNWIPRKSRLKNINEVVSFGLQKFIIKYLVNYFNDNFFNIEIDEIINEYEKFIKYTLGDSSCYSEHIRELHKLKYLPLEIRAIEEGKVVPIGIPMITIVNTDERFFWLTNYIETLISCEIWSSMTSATIAHEYRKILNAYALDTVGNTDFVKFQGHDFSMRGMSGVESAVLSGMGHLLSFVGTDTIPAICGHIDYYKADITKELVGVSVPATEHSVQCANGVNTIEEETAFARRLITEIYPNGIVSMVSDTINLWEVITKVLPQIKDDILNRDGKLVIRPDSGDPVDIICGKSYKIYNFDDKIEEYELTFEDCIDKMQSELEQEYYSNRTKFYGHKGESTYFNIIDNGKYYGYFKYEKNIYKIVFTCRFTDIVYSTEMTTLPSDYVGVVELLWNLFGGTINSKGYKELDPHIGVIYGDSITLERAKSICERLKAKGFASTNVVLGIGSYTYQYNTRDTFGFAMKSTHSVVDGKEYLLYKNPITDSGIKKSLKGLCIVTLEDGKYKVIDNLYLDEYKRLLPKDELKTFYKDGEVFNFSSLEEIRCRLSAQCVKK